MPILSTDKLKQTTVPSVIRKLFAGWLTALAMEYWLLPAALRDLSSLDGLAQISMGWVILITLAEGALLFGLSLITETAVIERWIIAVAFWALALGSLIASFTWPFLAFCVLIEAGLVIFALQGWEQRKEPLCQRPKSHAASGWIVAGLAVAFFGLISAWLVARVLSFCTPAFDFGIFAQMFHYMRTTGLPLTTVEREGLLSHFAVHVSPIYYLMLPVYWVFPFPATLQVLQAAIMASAVIPLWKIAKHHGLSDLQSILISAVLLLLPAYAGGASYDLHENCFLTPLLLWLIYGIDRKNIPITAIAAVLTLMVKEDAAVYVAVIALWLVIKTLVKGKKMDHHDLITGSALLASSLIWFFLATGYLARFGDGVMTNRYYNFMYDGSNSLITVIKSVILNPMKAIYECVDEDKLSYICMTMLPLLGLPLITRRYERYLLLIPYLLVNLMSDYKYQHDIFFQYSFGSTALLVYLVIVNLADLKINWVRVTALTLAVVIAGSFFVQEVIPKATRYPERAIENAEHHQSMQDLLDTIPKNASVATHTFYATQLSQRDVLYDFGNCTKENILSCDYLVVNPTYRGNEMKKFSNGDPEEGYENFLIFLKENGYALYTSNGYNIDIYRKSN